MSTHEETPETVILEGLILTPGISLPGVIVSGCVDEGAESSDLNTDCCGRSGAAAEAPLRAAAAKRAPTAVRAVISSYGSVA